MEEDLEKPKKSHTTLTAVLVLLLPVLYVLSVGPATKLFLRSPSLRSPAVSEIYKRFYAPLKWVVDKIPSTQEPMSNYVNYWMKP